MVILFRLSVLVDPVVCGVAASGVPVMLRVWAEIS